jgi:hypothetical protein
VAVTGRSRSADAPVAGDGAAELELLADLGDGELELLVAWITDGPPRPPESREELEAWGRDRAS